MSDQLYTCPCCGRDGFMLQGLKAHRCHSKVPRLNEKRNLEYPPLTSDQIAEAIRNAKKR